jgi:hypothetical protein
MDSTGLYEHFRSEISDQAKPYLWTDEDVWLYATDAYRMFVRLTGGIADFTSAATRVPIVTGDTVAPLHPSILRIMLAHRVSDGVNVTVVNQTDLMDPRQIDFGFVLKQLNLPRPGNIDYMVIGRQKHVAHYVAIPIVDDEIQMSIYRLPLVAITGDAQPLDDVEEEHHIHLIPWMKRMAYRKHDVETLDIKKSETYEAEFRAYCTFVKAEWDRMKHKNREVQYGGI